MLLSLDEASPISAQLQALSKDLHFRDRELMALCGISRATLARWRKEGRSERPPSLDDLRAIVVQLIESEALGPPMVAGWFRSRNKALEWQRPLDLLSQDEFHTVLKAARGVGRTSEKS